MATIHSITAEFLVAGKPVPLSAFDAALGTYGSAGHCNVTSSRSLLRAANVDLVKLTADAPSSTEVGLTVTLDGVKTKIFGGEYVSARWRFAADTIHIHCRDWAGLLVDHKRVLSAPAQQAGQYLDPAEVSDSSAINYQNQSLSQLVTSIAKAFGMTPKLNLTAGDPQVGSILGSSDTVYMPMPRSLWGILNRLARETGYEVHVTPQKELVFGVPGAGAAPLKLTWRVNPTPAGATPVSDLDIEHNPRRNLTFRVLVLSYDPGKAQTTKGEAYVLGTNMETSGTSSVKAGAWSGSEAAAITEKLSEAGGGHLQIPLYTFRVDGLTQDQAQARATAIAADIAKRELILTANLPLTPGIIPLNKVTLAGDVEPEFAGHTYYVNACSHHYKLPDPGGRAGSVETRVTALDVQTQGIGDPVTTGGAKA